MPQSENAKGADYETPPAIIASLVRGRTWELHCRGCERFIVVDVIKLLEHYAPYDHVRFDRAKCAPCGSKLNQTGGLVISGLRHTGKRRRSSPPYLFPALSSFSMISSRLKLAGFCRGGNSLKLASHFAANCCIGTWMNARSAIHLL